MTKIHVFAESENEIESLYEKVKAIQSIEGALSISRIHLTNGDKDSSSLFREFSDINCYLVVWKNLEDLRESLITNETFSGVVVCGGNDIVINVDIQDKDMLLRIISHESVHAAKEVLRLANEHLPVDNISDEDEYEELFAELVEHFVDHTTCTVNKTKALLPSFEIGYEGEMFVFVMGEDEDEIIPTTINGLSYEVAKSFVEKNLVDKIIECLYDNEYDVDYGPVFRVYDFYYEPDDYDAGYLVSSSYIGCKVEFVGYSLSKEEAEERRAE